MTIIQPTRRGLLIGGLASLVTAPAIVRAASIMPVRSLIVEAPQELFFECTVVGTTVSFDGCFNSYLGQLPVRGSSHGRIEWTESALYNGGDVVRVPARLVDRMDLWHVPRPGELFELKMFKSEDLRAALGVGDES